jgi:hypothetical protein
MKKREREMREVRGEKEMMEKREREREVRSLFKTPVSVCMLANVSCSGKFLPVHMRAHGGAPWT